MPVLPERKKTVYDLFRTIQNLYMSYIRSVILCLFYSWYVLSLPSLFPRMRRCRKWGETKLCRKSSWTVMALSDRQGTGYDACNVQSCDSLSKVPCASVVHSAWLYRLQPDREGGQLLFRHSVEKCFVQHGTVPSNLTLGLHWATRLERDQKHIEYTCI